MMTRENYTGYCIDPYSPEGQGPAISHEAPGSTREGILKHQKIGYLVKDPNLEDNRLLRHLYNYSNIFSIQIFFNKFHASDF